MTRQSEAPVPSGGSPKYNQNQCQNSTGLIPSQQRVIATGDLRRELVDTLSALWHSEGYEDTVVPVSGPYDRDTVFVVTFKAGNKSTEVGVPNAFGVEVTVHDWRPLLKIPALILDQDLLEIMLYAESVQDQARMTARGGRTILTAADQRLLIDELKTMVKRACRVSDLVENPRNWQGIPDSTKISVRWWGILPESSEVQG